MESEFDISDSLNCPARMYGDDSGNMRGWYGTRSNNDPYGLIKLAEEMERKCEEIARSSNEFNTMTATEVKERMSSIGAISGANGCNPGIVVFGQASNIERRIYRNPIPEIPNETSILRAEIARLTAEYDRQDGNIAYFRELAKARLKIVIEQHSAIAALTGEVEALKAELASRPDGIALGSIAPPSKGIGGVKISRAINNMNISNIKMGLPLHDRY